MSANMEATRKLTKKDLPEGTQVEIARGVMVGGLRHHEGGKGVVVNDKPSRYVRVKVQATPYRKEYIFPFSPKELIKL